MVTFSNNDGERVRRKTVFLPLIFFFVCVGRYYRFFFIYVLVTRQRTPCHFVSNAAYTASGYNSYITCRIVYVRAHAIRDIK